MKENGCGERRDEREMNCQVKKPADRDHGEGMDGKGLGMACERSRKERRRRKDGEYLFSLLIEILDA